MQTLIFCGYKVTFWGFETLELFFFFCVLNTGNILSLKNSTKKKAKKKKKGLFLRNSSVKNRGSTGGGFSLLKKTSNFLVLPDSRERRKYLIKGFSNSEVDYNSSYLLDPAGAVGKRGTGKESSGI